jgi:hypothetical protein
VKKDPRQSTLAFQAPENSINDEKKEINLMPEELLNFWPSIIDPQELM